MVIFGCVFSFILLSERMFAISWDRGTQILLEQNFGEDSDKWPEDDDPAWDEVLARARINTLARMLL